MVNDVLAVFGALAMVVAAGTTTPRPPPTTSPAWAGTKQLGTVEIIGRGQSEFTAKVAFTVPTEVNGWFIHLVFDKPVDVLETSEADVTKRSDLEFDLSSKNWNRHLYAGYRLVITLVGNITSNSTVLPRGGCTELRNTLRDPAELHTCSLMATALPTVFPENECEDHVDGLVTCDMLPGFCAVEYAEILCRRFCGLCKEEHGCNFEQSLCTWYPDSRPLFLNWTRESGFSGGLIGGPEKDHTFHTAAGNYLLATSEGGYLGQEAVLISEVLAHNVSHCLQLWHNIPAGRLVVYRQVTGVRTEQLAYVEANADLNTAHEEPWTKLKVTIPGFWIDFSVILSATPGDNKGPPLSVDDLSLREGSCDDSSPILVG